jgi:predicted ATP-grasp superfamily ATP-dependent carboligase
MSRYLAGAFTCPDTRVGDGEAQLTYLADIHNHLRRPAILVPTDDAAAVFISEHAGTLKEHYLFPLMPNGLARRLTNKKDLYALCRSIGVPCPEDVLPRSLGDVHQFMERAVFPVIVKAAESQRSPQGVRSTCIARTPSELLAIYKQAETPERPNLIFQEYIPQSSAEDWIVHGYRNAQTDCFVNFTGKKLRSFPPFAGLTSLGISVENEPLRRQAEKLLRDIGYAGIMDLDYRLDKRDGQYKLLDFNPRIGANFRMFEDRAGTDVVRALHLDLTGNNVLPLPAERRTFIVESHDLFASLSYLRHDGLTFRAWWQTLRGPREFAWLSLTDPMPFPVMCTRLVIQTARRAARRRWIRLGNFRELVRSRIRKGKRAWTGI